MKDIRRKIFGEAWIDDSVQKNLRALCLRFQGRFSGSADAEKAAEFIRDTFSSYGLEAAFDVFPVVAWKRGSATLRMSHPLERTFPCIALPYSAACDAEFELYDLKYGLPDEVAGLGDRIRNKAVLVDDINPPEGPRFHRLQKYLAARDAGAAVFIFVQNMRGMLPQTGSLAFRQDGDIHQTIPALGIPREVGFELREWLRDSPVKIRVNIAAELSPGKDRNIIGEIQGKTPGNPLVIIGAHYDGHDIAQGALDNASGTAAVMETARILSTLREHVQGTIRFILFGSEEVGLVGSHHYAERVISTGKDEVRFVMNLDCVGNNAPLNVALQNCPELMPRFRDYFIHLSDSVAVTSHVVPFSDHFPFVLKGIPAAFCFTPGGPGRGWGHTFADTFEKVSIEAVRKTAALTAWLTCRISREEDWPGTIRTPEQVLSFLKPLHLEKLLRFEGHWPVS